MEGSDGRREGFADDSKLEKCYKGSILSCDKFDDNPDLSDRIKESLREMGYTHMTQIQTYAIPKLLAGKDVLGAAKTGSGKTLAFVVPALDLLWRVKATPKMGTLVLFIGPTRELALQILEVVREVGKNVTHTFGSVIGGQNKSVEEKKLATGINLLVATPGRLLDHLQHTQDFVYKNLAFFVMDEADRMLDEGFERELTTILRILPKKRQTALFSATQTTKVGDLIRLSLKEPTLIEIRDDEATVHSLKQYYIICESRDRLSLLYKILKEKSKATVSNPDGQTRPLKIMVFFSTCQSTQFHEDLFRLFDGLSVLSLHGKKKQSKRFEVYNKFCTASSGILFCTNVAARGLDVPSVDLIIQYDPPGKRQVLSCILVNSDDVREYIHRVGRTARGESGEGSALLFLVPEEGKFLTALKEARVKPTAMTANFASLQKIQTQLETIIAKTPDLTAMAVKAYTKFLLAYNSHGLKDVFSMGKLDMAGVASSFALSAPPRVDLPGINKFKTGQRKRPAAGRDVRERRHPPKAK